MEAPDQQPEPPKNPYTRPIWQLILLFLVLWAIVLWGMVALLPGVNLDQGPIGLLSLSVLTALIAGRITLHFR